MSDQIYENGNRNLSQDHQIVYSNIEHGIIDNRQNAIFQRKYQELATSYRRISDIVPDRVQFKTTQLTGNEEELPLQKKASTIQMTDTTEEEESVQTKSASMNSVQLVENVQKPNTTGLPDSLKTGIENLSGMSIDNVNVHYNSDRPAQLNALAYTQGTDIHVASGQEKHLAHEAWHVVQQMQGRVEPTLQMNGGVAINDDKGLEEEADKMGDKAKG